MHKVYDEAVKQMGQEEEVHARHILIRAAADDEKASKAAEDKIKAIIVRLKNGEDFAKLAGEVTEDPSGKANGGDLGYFTKDQMVPEFSDVAFKLDKGQISDPVKTQFGWHVIKVEDKRAKPMPNFEEVKPQIEQFVTRKAQAELVNSLRASAKIERLDKPVDAAGPGAGCGEAGRTGQESRTDRAHQLISSWPGLSRPFRSGGIFAIRTAVAWYAARDLPPRPAARAGHAGDRRREDRDRRSRHPLCRPHRRAAGVCSTPGTTAAGVFTESKCPSAPVEWCRAQLKRGKAKARRARWWSIPATPMPSPARAAARPASSPPTSPPRGAHASPARYSSPRPA